MRAILIFLCFVVLAYLLGAVLAYPLKLLLDSFIDLEYKKYINYATLFCGLLVSGMYLKTCGVLSLPGFGYAGDAKRFATLLFKAFIYGIGIIILIELFLFVLGIHEFDSRRAYTFDEFAIRIIKGLISGLLISILEESIFRGGLFAGLHKRTGAVMAVVVSSLLYSAVHFIRYREVPEGLEPGWFTGLYMMPDAFRRFYEWSILDYFLTLFMFGVLLALLRLRFNNIAACIGLHAGVVAAIKTADYYGNRTYDSQFDFLVNHYNSTFGWLSFAFILLFSMLFYFNQLGKR